MSRIIIALDYPTGEQALDLVHEIGRDAIYKIGMELFNAEGPAFVKKLTGGGYKVFLDLKYHDIPNTVAGAAKSAVRTGCFMFNVHALGGKAMMEAAAKAARQEALASQLPLPKIIAVTILTSMSADQLKNELQVTIPLKEYVVSLAIMAKEAGLDGVVASPHEIVAIRQACGEDFLIVTPGVRPSWAALNDQQRVMTPKEAIMTGASFVVVGRPITAHAEPIKAFKLIMDETGAKKC